MGSVLPRENSGVDAAPWRRFTQSTGSRRNSALGAIWLVRRIPGTNDTFLHQNGADRSQPGGFQECAPAWTNRLILEHLRQRHLFVK